MIILRRFLTKVVAKLTAGNKNEELLIEALNDINAHAAAQEIRINLLTHELEEMKRVILSCNEVAAFLIQNQQEIASHINMSENARRGKILPGTIAIGPDDLPN